LNLILSDIFTLLINVGYIHLLLTKKRSIKDAFFILLINSLTTLVIYVLFYIFFKDTIFYEYLPYLLGFTFIIYISLVFEESLSKKIFTMFTIWLFSNMMLIISSYLLIFLHIKNYDLYIYFSLLLRDFIQLVCVPLIYFYFRGTYKEIIKLVSNKVINIISFYSITVFIFLLRYYELYSYNFINSYGFFNSLLFIIIIILSYIIIFITMSSVNKNIELEDKVRTVDIQIELQRQNYKNLNNSFENYYAFKHDTRHHLLAIKSMIDAENYVAASEYLEKFNENEISQNIEILCKNFTVDSILKHYMSIAVKNDIKFKANLNIPEDINIDNLDLSIIIGNCVENAIDACNKIVGETQKYININAEIKGFNLILKIANSFHEKIVLDKGKIKTSKKLKGHGIGLSNVRKTVEKYNGFFDIKYSDIEFEVIIIIGFN